MREITFEMATELGLIPRPSQRINSQMMFESYQGYKDRMDRQEIGYRLDLKRIEERHKTVHFRGETLKVV